jgi:hypothetical protein
VNSLIRDQYGNVEMTQALIAQAFDMLGDADLDYSPGPGVPTVRELFAEQAAIQAGYTEGFRTFKGNFHAFAPADIDASTVETLRTGFERLNAELKETLAAISEEDLASRQVDRGGEFIIPVTMQLHIYRESILILCGKLWVSFRLLGLSFPEQWVDWIG